MGIDRSNVRCVLHATMPKSIEHYQQETGRAGRDGLEAECVLLYSQADVMRWESLMGKSNAEAQGDAAELAEAFAAQVRLLRQMQRYCSAIRCRHQELSEYFGQAYTQTNCGACDTCLGETEDLADATVTAQKILSCVARTQERFGVGHVVDVLLGAETQVIRQCGHEQLSTYGLLRNMPKKTLQNLVYQLVDQGLATRTEGDRPVLRLNAESWEVLRGKKQVRLIEPKKQVRARTAQAEANWEGVDRGLCEFVRGLRKELAEQRAVPPYVIFADTTLRELARIRPTELAGLRMVKGLGDKRIADFGDYLLEQMRGYCVAHELTTNQLRSEDKPRPRNVNVTRDQAFEMYRAGRSVQEVTAATGRAASTAWQYLAEYLAEEQPADVEAWVDAATYQRVRAAVEEVGATALRPIFDMLIGAVAFALIGVVVAQGRGG